jgi:hypothetical protein
MASPSYPAQTLSDHSLGGSVDGVKYSTLLYCAWPSKPLAPLAHEPTNEMAMLGSRMWLPTQRAQPLFLQSLPRSLLISVLASDSGGEGIV